MSLEEARSRRLALELIAGLALVALTVVILRWMGHQWICDCGVVRLFHGGPSGPENSQHLTDWYTPSHIIHGFVFYFLLWLVVPRWPLGRRALAALFVECAWEVIENTPWIMNRYREATVSFDYFGDSVINTTFDIVAAMVGFFLAARLPVWLVVALAIAMEVFTGIVIRDNLILNIIMLLTPLDAIKEWQAGA